MRKPSTTVVVVVAALLLLAAFYGLHLVAQLTPEAAFWNTHPLLPKATWSWWWWWTTATTKNTPARLLPPPELSDLERFASAFELTDASSWSTTTTSASVATTAGSGRPTLTSVPARLWLEGSASSGVPARAVVASDARTPSPRALAHHWLATTRAGDAAVLLFQAHADDIPPSIAPLLSRYRRTVVDVSASCSRSSSSSAASLLTKRNARLHSLFGSSATAALAQQLQVRIFVCNGEEEARIIPEWAAHRKRMIAAAPHLVVISSGSSTDALVVRCVWYLEADAAAAAAGGCEIAIVDDARGGVSVVLSSVYFHLPSFAARLDQEDTEEAKLEFLRRSLREAVRVAGVLRVTHVVALEWSPHMDFVFQHLLTRILRPNCRHHVVLLDADRSLSVFATCLQPPAAAVYISPAVFLRRPAAGQEQHGSEVNRHEG